MPGKGRSRTFGRLLADFLFVWKPYQPKRRTAPETREGPSDTQFRVIRRAKEHLKEELPSDSVTRLRLPDGSTWPIRGQVRKQTPEVGHLRALPVELLARVLQYLGPAWSERVARGVSLSKRDRRHLKRCLRSDIP
jgi:hypothetical protein